MPAYLSAFPHLLGRNINPYDIHQKVWEAFPGMDDENIPFLFTIQEVDGYVYIRSTIAPSWEINGVRVKQENTFYPEGSVLFIEVIINPVKRTRDHEITLTDKEAIRDFAVNLLEKHGVSVEIDEDVFQLFTERLSGKPLEKNGISMPLHLNRCFATVTVTDSALFQKAIEKGIGRKKFAGAGLILVRHILS